MTEHNTLDTARQVEQDDLITLIFTNGDGDREVVVGEATYAGVFTRNGGIDVGDYALMFKRGEATVEKWTGDCFEQVSADDPEIYLDIDEKARERFVAEGEVAL